MKPFKLLFATVLLSGNLVRPVLAQTSRIAHFSHSGSTETLGADEATDNFGGPPLSRTPLSPPESAFIYDSIRLTSDSTALEYGKWRAGYHNPEQVRSRRLVFKATTKDKREMVQYYHEHHPQVKLIGFDTTDIPARGVPHVRTKRLKKQIKSAVPSSIPMVPPQHPGVLLAVALIVGLGSLGWLLGEQAQINEPARG